MTILEFMNPPPLPLWEQPPRLWGIYDWREANRAMHSHPNLLEINFIMKGIGTYIINNEICYAQTGDILIYNSNSLHDESLILPTQVDTCCIAITNLKLPHLPNDTLLPSDLRPVIPSGAAYNDLKRLYEMVFRYSTLTDGYPLANNLAQSIVLIVYNLIKKHSEPIQTEECQLIRRVQQYINNHYMEELTLPALAAQFHTSEYYLSHLFRRITSYTPMNYIMRRRIGEAQTRLIYTDQELVLIASQVGYADSNYFSRIFKKIVGLPPSRYRQEWRRQMNPSKKQEPQTAIGHVTL